MLNEQFKNSNHPTHSLKHMAVAGIQWTGIANAALTVIHFITITILAHILQPADFGIMGMLMVVIFFGEKFSDMGLSNALIHRQDIDRNHFSSFFWTNVITGSIIFAIIILGRPIIAGFFQEPLLPDYLMVCGLIFLITPAGQLFNTLLRKEMRFKALAIVDITGSCIYALITISFATSGFGIWSLILGQVIRSLSIVGMFIFIFRSTWLPKFHLRFSEIKSFLSFGAFQLGERMVNYFGSHVDYIIIGRFLGPESLGYYALAYQIMIFPLMKINPIITKVAFPVFAKLQHDNAAMRSGYGKAITGISMLTFPMLAGMFVVAPEFIRLIYGTQWIPSIIII
ncbi:MAG: MOP flippase family protein, partial [Elusimicrobia bacterium]|nr:MOP flippase family protein [Elusimicrobiota bacterium]MBD3412645.1 MOP flippase family protein [Elusimicrobiota bacterium]